MQHLNPTTTPASTITWVQRGSHLCLKINDKFTVGDCAIPDLLFDGEAAAYWRKQLLTQLTELQADPAAVFAALDEKLAELRGHQPTSAPADDEVAACLKAVLPKLRVDVHNNTNEDCSFDLTLWANLVRMSELLAMGFSDYFGGVDAFEEVHDHLVNAREALERAMDPADPDYLSIWPETIDSLVNPNLDELAVIA